jgi:hypothetical protein
MTPDSEEFKELEALLGRSPSVSVLKDGTFMADYFEIKAPATKFVAADPRDALKNLLEYLRSKPKPEQ